MLRLKFGLKAEVDLPAYFPDIHFFMFLLEGLLALFSSTGFRIKAADQAKVKSEAEDKPSGEQGVWWH